MDTTTEALIVGVGGLSHSIITNSNGLSGNPTLQQQATAYLDPNYWNASVNTIPEFGLSVDQRTELMQHLETTGMGDMRMMIAGANRLFNPNMNQDQGQ